MDLIPLTDKQKDSIELARESRIAVWEGSVRSSKTVVSLIAWADFLLNSAPDGPLIMIGRTQDTLRRNAFEPLQDLVGAHLCRATWGDGRGTILGRDVHLVGADNSAAESRIRGLTLAGTYVDELTIVGGPKGDDYWRMLLSRHSIKGARILATTNPGSPTHWLLDDYLAKALVTLERDGTITRPEEPTPEMLAMNLHRYRFVIGDNSSLPAEFVDSIKASMAGMFYRRFIDGEWVAAEGAIYPMLDLTPGGKHVYPVDTVIPPLDKPTIGIDHGHTNATHAVALGVDAHGSVWVVGECRLDDKGRVKNSQLTPSQQAEILAKWVVELEWPPHPPAFRGLPSPESQPATVVVDPAAKGFRNAWHATTGAWPRSADNSVLAGISDVASLLGQGRLRFVEGASPVLLRELSGYVWDSSATDRSQDAPVKKDDHGPDALRYGLRSMRVLEQLGGVASGF